MKKLLTLTLIAAAMVSQAVSFTWNSNSVKIQFDGSTTAATSGKITAMLLYLGSSTSATIGADGYSVANGLVTKTSKTKSTGLASGRGIYSDTFDNTIGETIGSSSSVLSKGDYFTVLLSYTDESDVTWYNLSSTVWQLPADATDVTQGLTAKFSHSFAMNDPGTALTAGGGWTSAAPIPEPGTAAMALLGLGLLIRRREA